MKKIAIVMGSNSDYKIMKDASKVLNDFEIDYHIQVVSAHRTPTMMYDFASTALANGYKVIIAAAGGAAHLPGMIASLTTLPVIGVPIKARSLEGLDSLLSIVQMPAGVPVATVGINQAANAALLALQILATSDNSIASKLESYKEILVTKVMEMELEDE
jgi:phosphoribosylaminoimidazole carboxylase PurE protein